MNASDTCPMLSLGYSGEAMINSSVLEWHKNDSKRDARKWKMIKEFVVQVLIEPITMLKKSGI
jgi:hypothetical protein